MSGLEVTADYTSPNSPPAEDSFTPKPAVLDGSTPRLSTETQALLKKRLWGATLMLLIGLSLFFFRDLFLPDRSIGMLAYHAVLLLLLGTSLVPLSGRHVLSLRRLRAIELLVFGLTTIFFAAAQYRMLLTRDWDGNMAGAVAGIKNSVIDIFALMALYGIFIPNTWRRAAMVVVPMALTPPLVVAVLGVVHPEVKRPSLFQLSSFEQVSDDFLMLLLGAGTSIFGSHLINTLRTEVFEARQLGQYRLGELIGAGGMGEVYLAEHQLMKRPCAIKLIRPGRAADPQALVRFEREVRATALLSHWNTVEIFDYGRTEDGTFFYVMEYLPGLSLADIVERYGPMPPERIIHLLTQACQALEEAHGAGLIHRDIKPANIFAAQRGGHDDVTKLLDFGLVLSASETSPIELSQERTVTGSPLYMSPEQATGQHRPDRRSDIYSLGAVAYYLLTGRPPFDGANALGVMIAHTRDAVIPPSVFRQDTPDDLERVILRCLAKAPDERYPDAASLEQALNSCEAAGKWSRTQAARWWSALKPAPPGPHHPLRATAEYTP